MKVPSTVFMFVPQENTVFCKHIAKIVKISYTAKETHKNNKSKPNFLHFLTQKTQIRTDFSRFLNTESHGSNEKNFRKYDELQQAAFN